MQFCSVDHTEELVVSEPRWNRGDSRRLTPRGAQSSDEKRSSQAARIFFFSSLLA